MATIKERVYRKNTSGTYDVIHHETESSIVMRPNGHSVEQDLAAQLPVTQNNDNVPESLTKLIIGKTKSFIHGKEIAYVDPSSGTPYSREQIWKAATAALYGLGPDSVPDDGFAWLGKYAQHWWKRRKVTYGTSTSSVATELFMETNDGDSKTVYYSDKISVVDGKIELVSPSTLIVQSRKPAQCNNNLPGKYVTDCYTENSYLFPGKDNVFYIDPSATFSYSSSTGYLITTEKAYLVSIEVQYSDWEYVQSSSRSAYPDSGEQGGYEYQYLGIPFDNAVAAPKIVTGSYVGTGTYGSSNPNSLTADFEPKMVVITDPNNTYVPNFIPAFMLSNEYKQVLFRTRGSAAYMKKDSKTVSWYVQSDSDGYSQLNSSGKTYDFLILG